MASTPFLTGGRAVMSLVALSTSIACYIADFNETHVYNPKWPPHARFHNGQTMTMGLTLGILTGYLIWRPVSNPAINAKDSTFLAALVSSLYYVAGLSAILYPGTKWEDEGNGHPQFYVFAGHIGLTWIGYALTIKGLGAARGMKSA